MAEKYLYGIRATYTDGTSDWVTTGYPEIRCLDDADWLRSRHPEVTYSVKPWSLAEPAQAERSERPARGGA
jgi:hypothetical protein